MSNHYQKKYPALVETIIAWIIGIALMLFAIFVPFAWIYSIRESIKADKKSRRRSYRFGWTNKPWK